MTDEDAFLKAICAAPDDDTPRLVFADFLQERGATFDTAWAACIRTQVRLAAGPPADERAALEKKVRALETPFFRERWLARMGLNLSNKPYWGLYWGARWDRGFITDLSGRFDRVREVRPRFVERVPFRQLEIDIGALAHLEQMTAWPELSRLTTLTVTIHEESGDIGDPHLSLLANCPALAGLVTLHLRFVSLTDRGAVELLNSIPLRGVRELSLVWRRQAGETLSRAVRRRLTNRFGPHCLR